MRRSDDYRKIDILKVNFHGVAIWGEYVYEDDERLIVYAKDTHYEVNSREDVIDYREIECPKDP